MDKKKIADGLLTAVKYGASIVMTMVFIESGYQGGKALVDDIECVVDVIDSKVNPTVMKKRHWYSKPEEYNTRTNQYVADKKKSKN